MTSTEQPDPAEHDAAADGQDGSGQDAGLME